VAKYTYTQWAGIHRPHRSTTTPSEADLAICALGLIHAANFYLRSYNYGLSCRCHNPSTLGTTHLAPHSFLGACPIALAYELHSGLVFAIGLHQVMVLALRHRRSRRAN
jgi:hypothetical protein